MLEAIIGGSLLVFFLLAIIGIAIYFVPTFIAIKRDHPQKLPIILINVIFGATLIGWVGALVWALMSDKPKQ